MHLIVDGYGGDAVKLADRRIIWRFLSDTPGAIGMTAISSPFIFEYSGGDNSQAGLTGIVVIAESHLTIHTWPEHGLVYADIFSCKGFDADRVVEILIEAFALFCVEVDKLERGLEYETNNSLMEMAKERADAT